MNYIQQISSADAVASTPDQLTEADINSAILPGQSLSKLVARHT